MISLIGYINVIFSYCSWQIDGETVETVSDFILGGSKIIVDVDCSHEIKRHLLLGRKVITNLCCITPTQFWDFCKILRTV